MMEQRILQAVRDMNLQNGFRPRDVVNYIVSNYGGDRVATSRRVYLALARGVGGAISRIGYGTYAVTVRQRAGAKVKQESDEESDEESDDESDVAEADSDYDEISASDLSDYDPHEFGQCSWNGKDRDCGIMTEKKKTKKPAKKLKSKCKKRKTSKSVKRRKVCKKAPVHRRKSAARKAACKKRTAPAHRRKSVARKGACKKRTALAHRRKSVARKGACKKRTELRKSRGPKRSTSHIRRKARKSVCAKRKSRKDQARDDKRPVKARGAAPKRKQPKKCKPVVKKQKCPPATRRAKKHPQGSVCDTKVEGEDDEEEDLEGEESDNENEDRDEDKPEDQPKNDGSQQGEQDSDMFT